jgi:hypothetical protein
MRGWRITTPPGRISLAGAARPSSGSGSPTARSPRTSRPPGLLQRQRRLPRPAADRPSGVSRWVNARGTISLAGFSSAGGASYAGEPVEVVVAEGLVDIVHAGVVVATHAQRSRADQADRAPRARVSRRARDAG